MKKAVILSFLLMFQVFAFTQDGKLVPRHTIDSLENLLPGSKVLDRIKTLNKIASALAPVSFDSSMNYASLALRLGTQNTWPFEIGVAKMNIGNAYYYKLDLRNALLSYLSALKILEIFKPSKELGDLYLQLGHINYLITRSDKAISFYHQAIGEYNASGNEQLSWQGLISISMTFLMDRKLDSSLVYSLRLLENARKLHDRKLEGYALEIAGGTFINEKNSVETKQKALFYYNQALEIGIELGDEELISNTYLNLGNYYDRLTPLYKYTGNPILARAHYNKAYLAAGKVGILYLEAMSLSMLAGIDILVKKYNDAEIKLNRCETKFDSFFLSPERNKPGGPIVSFAKMYDYRIAQQERSRLYLWRYNLALAEGDCAKVSKYLWSYFRYQDTINSVERDRQFDLMMVEADNERADQKIRILSQENELKQLKLSKVRFVFAGIGAVAAIISLFLLLFFQRKRMYAEQKSILMEQRLLRAQMNPHFLFNSLASIQNYIINEKTDQATVYLSRFSQLVRNVLDNSAEEYVSLENEVDAIRNYLELQKVRYAGKFDYRMTVDERIDPESTLIPPMLAQPFIENAIEHGIKHMETPGHIDIRFIPDDGMILFEVEDNGVGREKAREIESRSNSKHRSMSTSITRDRLFALNRKKKKKIRMEIIDLKDAEGVGCGTRVTFGIPIAVGSRQ